MNPPAADIYDALAPHYREYADKRSAYLAAVDDFVLEQSAGGRGEPARRRRG